MDFTHTIQTLIEGLKYFQIKQIKHHGREVKQNAKLFLLSIDALKVIPCLVVKRLAIIYMLFRGNMSTPVRNKDSCASN